MEAHGDGWKIATKKNSESRSNHRSGFCFVAKYTEECPSEAQKCPYFCAYLLD